MWTTPVELGMSNLWHYYVAQTMDALTAIGLASNIVAFVDFTTKLLNAAHTLYVSTAGTTAENLELELLGDHVRILATKASSTPQLCQPFSKEDAALIDLATQCNQVSNQLAVILNGLKAQGPHKKWKSIYQALRSSRHAAEIEAIQNRLDRIRDQMSSHMLLQKHDRLIEKLDHMEAESRKQDINRNREITDLQVAVQQTFDRLEKEKDQNRNDIRLLAKIVTHAETMKTYSHEQDVLRYLRFDAMDHRRVVIKSAHETTYSWVFDKSSQLVEWLRSDSSLFWVSGKPGSGKSTFMKYVSQHNLLAEHLKAWSGTQTVVTANFFFWNLGKKDLQKSQEGLLRSVLYQILRQQPSLIKLVYPRQPDIKLDYDPVSSEDTTNSIPVDELLAAIQRLSATLATSNVKYCFFIDGLDEYEGKPDDIISLVTLLKNTLQVKVCVSSRPWNEFEKVFGQDNSAKLYMQDLTRGDIEAYVRDTFEKDMGFQEFMDENEEDTLDLISDIVNGANGVFLWVRLVVQSLLEGLTNADRASDLRRRLNSMPKDLNEFFERIIFGIDNFYHQQTSHFFQITLEASVALPLMCYWYIDQEDVANDEPKYALELAIQPLTVQRTTIRLKQIRKRLNAYCKGLLEVQFYESSEDDNSSLGSSVLFNWKVDFLHRTVRDFLQTPEMEKLLQKWGAPGFNVDVAICGGILAQIKTAPQEEEYFNEKGPITVLIDAFASHANFHQPRLVDGLRAAIEQQRSICGIGK
jgi:hypothetical protein